MTVILLSTASNDLNGADEPNNSLSYSLMTQQLLADELANLL